MSRLVLSYKDRKKTIPLGAKPLLIGRAPSCGVHLQSASVSRQHALVIEKDGVCGLMDLGSSNGTFVNGVRVAKSIRLNDGDRIQIAEFRFDFEASKPPARDPDNASGKVAAKNVAPAPGVPTPVEDGGTPRTNGERVADAAVSVPRDSEPEKAKTDALELAMPGPLANDDATAVDDEEDVKETFHSDEPLSPVADGKEEDRSSVAEAETAAAPPGPEALAAPGESAIDVDPEAAEREESVLNKAAVEAGLVGEFSPEFEAPPPIQAVDSPAIESLPLSDNLREAIEIRLSLYLFLADLQRERERLLASRPGMADAVKAELARQQRELQKLPTARQAEAMLEKREAKARELQDATAAALKAGEIPPLGLSPDMLEAEDLANSQWQFIIQSEDEALPTAFAEGYKLTRDEPLAETLAGAGFDVASLFGGAAYLLAVERMLGENQSERQRIRGKLSVGAPDRKGGRFNFFSRGDESGESVDEAVAPPGESPGELSAREQMLANRSAWLAQELAERERVLIQEFWRLYVAVAEHYIPVAESMPSAVRAFLRHGAIGFKPWWMPIEVAGHILIECAEDTRFPRGEDHRDTHILFADEYLTMVARSECTPALDENLELNQRNSPAWKADKALRRLIFARRRRGALIGLLEDLGKREEELREEIEDYDRRLAGIFHGPKGDKTLNRDLQQKQQSVKVELTKVTKLRAKLRDETLSGLDETIKEAEARFASGELSRPATDFLIRRECEAIRKIGRLLANLKERFAPLTIRDHYKPGTDAMNDRRSIEAEIRELERRDPGVFLETLAPAKRRRDQISLRVSPAVVIIPAAGLLAYSWNPRSGPENGRLALPTCFIRQRLRERQMIYLFSDFRWDTSKANAGMDVLTSDTIVAAFMTVRWDWRKRSKEAREKGLVFTDQNDRTNWRRVYEAYIQTAFDGGKKLYNRNYDFYERIVGRYFDLPDGVVLFKK